MKNRSSALHLLCLAPLILGLHAQFSCAHKNRAPNGQTERPRRPEGSASLPTETEHCPKVAPPYLNGTISEKKLHELSGLVSSRQNPGLLWTHNDSGDGPHLYALSEHGQLHAALHLPVRATDWEDIALLPRKGAPDYLYIADTGDNNESRKGGVFIHRIEEPDVRVSSVIQRSVATAETMALRYPDGPKDTEALFVDPIDEKVYLLSKHAGRWPQLYSANSFRSGEQILQWEASLAPSHTIAAMHLVTGADISTQGRWIVLRTYTGIFLFERRPGQSVKDALTSPACELSPPEEAQGEAIAFMPPREGDDECLAPPDIITVSEGSPTGLYRLRAEARSESEIEELSACPLP